MAARTPERFVEEIGKAIDDVAVESEGRVDVVRRKQRSIVAACGWGRSSNQRMARLAALLDRQGIGHRPTLTETHLTPETWLRFSKEHIPTSVAVAPLFTSEHGLQHFVHRYFDDIFRNEPSLTELRNPRKEAPITIGGKRKRMDMLFDDPDGGKVIVEFKREDPTDGVVTQLRSYMSALREKQNVPVRGVIVSARPLTAHRERSIRQAIGAHAATDRIDWFWYSVDVDIRSAGEDA